MFWAKKKYPVLSAQTRMEKCPQISKNNSWFCCNKDGCKMSVEFLSHGGALLLLIRKSANTCIHVIWMYYDAFETYKRFIVVTGLTLLFFWIPLFQFGSCFSSRRPLLLFEGCGNTFMCKTIQCGPVSFRVALCVTSRSAVQPYSLSSMKQVISWVLVKAAKLIKSLWSTNWGNDDDQ